MAVKSPKSSPISRFVVGIDLGTTNSAVALVDTAADEPVIQLFRVPQLTAVATVEERSLLPSFSYVPGEGELPAGALKLPWSADGGLVVGELARRRGAEVPTRLITSAKSWLSYGGADRTAPILPWGAP